MTKRQVEVITSVQRRRRWSIGEKERIVAAAVEPGAVASEVARAAGIHVSQLFRRRRQLCDRGGAGIFGGGGGSWPKGRADVGIAARGDRDRVCERNADAGW
jgi:transposase